MAESSARTSPLHVRFGEFELDEANARVLRHGKAVPLSPTPFGLLCALLRHPGALLTKHVLLDEVWGHRFVSDSVLKGAISDVRTILEDDPQRPRFIETVPRRGYRFIAVLQAPSMTSPRSLSAVLSTSASSAREEAPDRSFVGRAREVASLRGAWERVNGGQRVVFWIAGEPGIGKSTLIQHFIQGLGEVACARGHCVQHYGSSEPYLPILEALGELCRSDTSAPTLLRAVAPTWLLQLPWLSTAEQREALLRELIGVNMERMLREMGEFLDRYTERKALLLVTEDLHWADGATVQLMDYLARRRSKGSLLWLSSFRLSEVIAGDLPLNALRHELRLHGLCEEIVLDSFSEAEVAEYLALGSPSMATDESYVRALHERTGGVPLFVASVARDVAARGLESGADTAALLVNSPVPENLFAIINHYLARLGNERRLMLSAAAVCGLEFRIDTLARVLERDVLGVADACEQLSREKLWLAAVEAKAQEGSTEMQYRFRHALFRQALYDSLAPSARADLHRKVGTALDQDRASGHAVAATELAMHFDRGRVPMAALRYYAEAAKAALLHVSLAECMNLTERASSLLGQAPDGSERKSIEIELATLRGVSAFHLLGVGDEARIAYQRGYSLLADVPRHPMRGLLLHGFGFLLNLRGKYAEALDIATRADDLASEGPDAFLSLAACTARGQAYMHQGKPQAAREALEHALPVMAAVDAASEQSFIGFIADPQVTLLAMLSLSLAHMGMVGEARERLQQAHTRARRLAQPMSLLVAIWYQALCEIRFGDTDRVAGLAEEMHSLVEEFALAQGKSACRWFRGWVEARRGDPARGFRQIREGFEQNTALGMIAGSSETLGYAAEALILQGDFNGAEQQLQQAFEIVETYGERIYLPQLLLIESAIARARGQFPAADAAIRRAIVESRDQGARWLELLALSELCAGKNAARNDRAALATLVAELGQGIETPALAKAKTLLKRTRSN